MKICTREILFIAVLFLVVSASLARPVYAQSEMKEFFNQLLYGDASWLFIIIFLGIGFLITWKIEWFSVIMMVACLFMAINYLTQTPMTNSYIYSAIVLLVAMCMFILRLAGVLKD
jgi:hypothetical protein